MTPIRIVGSPCVCSTSFCNGYSHEYDYYSDEGRESYENYYSDESPNSDESYNSFESRDSSDTIDSYERRNSDESYYFQSSRSLDDLSSSSDDNCECKIGCNVTKNNALFLIIGLIIVVVLCGSD